MIHLPNLELVAAWITVAWLVVAVPFLAWVIKP